MSLECSECERDARGPHGWECSRNAQDRVRIREVTVVEGKVLGPDVTGPDGMTWTPVLWDGEEDPDWYKTYLLEKRTPHLSFAYDIGGVSGRITGYYNEPGTVTLEWCRATDAQPRQTRFPRAFVVALVSNLLRGCGVASFMWRASGRHNITMKRGEDARGVLRLT